MTLCADWDIEWWDVMPLFPFLRVCPRWLYTDTLPVAWPCVSPSEPSPAHARTPSHPPPTHITLADTGIHSEKDFRWLLQIEMISWKWNSWGELVLRRWDRDSWMTSEGWVTLFPVNWVTLIFDIWCYPLEAMVCGGCALGQGKLEDIMRMPCTALGQHQHLSCIFGSDKRSRSVISFCLTDFENVLRVVL